MRYVQLADMLDPGPYLAVLGELERDLPDGAFRFASDPDHYDFYGPRCVHDLELAAVELSDEPNGTVELRFAGNQWKHEGDLLIRYFGLESCDLGSGPGRPAGHRLLGDLILDEILPHESGAQHEMVFEAGTVRIVCEDLNARWVDHVPDQYVYVFTPKGATYPAGIWNTESEAGTWIVTHGAVGMLSKYAVGLSAHQAVVDLGLLRLDRPERETVEFIRNFTSAVDHWHFGDAAEG